ncbi:MAG: pinensin family lanthipeptide [Acidobacteriota bacterium]|nr:pinensin family lanthipeptide [Acidobacteriota bacterium]
MKKRLKLNDLKVSSFLTSDQEVRGGLHTDNCVPLTQGPGDSNMLVCQSIGVHCSYGDCSGFATQHANCTQDPLICN